jgi:hypothetical protein
VGVVAVLLVDMTRKTWQEREDERRRQRRAQEKQWEALEATRDDAREARAESSRQAIREQVCVVVTDRMIRNKAASLLVLNERCSRKGSTSS